MIVVNTRTGESYITDSREATIITDKNAMNEEIKHELSQSRSYEFDTGRKGTYNYDMTYTTSFGCVKIVEVMRGDWKAYEDSPAARVLYKANR